MCTGLEIAALTMAGGQAVVGAKGAIDGAEAQMANNVAALEDQYDNSRLQAEEIQESTEQQYTDRMREARKELASLSVMLAETGATGRSGDRLLYEQAYGENVDLMRIEDNAQVELDALDNQNRAAYKSVKSQNKTLQRQGKYQALGAVLGGVSNAASIGMSAQHRKKLLNSQAKGG